MTQSKEQAQIQLQNALTTTFLANLAFLSEYDNELYHRVDELSRMIENGTYKEKYALEFVMEDGDFDIYDIVNDTYLYDRKPKKRNDELVRDIEFNGKNSIMDIAKEFYLKEQISIDRNKRFDFSKIEDFNKLLCMDAFEYTNTLNNFVEEKAKKRLKKIDKFIFLGTLLGRHIPRIAEKIDAKMYLVLERNLEIFRLSLFTVDYTVLAKKGVVFSIMNDYMKEESYIEKFLSTSLLDNYLIKFSTTGINIEEYIDRILSIKQSLSPNLYDYNRRNYVYINRSTKYISEYRILQFNEIKKDCNIFNDKPILYLASGPSLDEHLEWIKENQNKFYIVTIGSAYKKLLEQGIKIDIITTFDEQELLLTLQFDDNSVSKIDKNTIIFASTITNEKVLKKFNQENLFLYEPYIPFYQDNVMFGGYSIGEMSLYLILQFNPKNVYIVGLDLALDQNTGETHSKGANSGINKFNLSKIDSREKFVLKESLIKVKGNMQNEVYTTPLFYLSIKDLESNIKRFDINNTNIFNLSTNGAYFEGVEPLKVDNLDVNKFLNIDAQFDFRGYLYDFSETELNEDSKQLLKEELNFLNTEINKVICNIKAGNFNNYDEFEAEILTIVIKTFDNRFLKVYQIIFEYFKFCIPFFSYYFNDIKIKNERKQVKKVQDIFIKQIENLLEDYKYFIERLIK